MLRIVATLVFSLIAGAAGAKTEKAPLIPIRDFFKNPEQAAFQISPNGKYISFSKPWEKRMNLFVRENRPGASEKQLTFLKDRDLAYYSWKGNKYLLYARDFGGDENFHVFAIDVTTGKEKDLTPWPKLRADVVDDLEDVNDDEILLSHNKRDPRVFDVFRYNLKTGTSKQVGQNNGKIVSWLTDHKGRLRVAIESDGVNNSILYRENESDKFKKIISTDFRESFSPAFFTMDDKHLIALSNIGRDKDSVVEFDPATKKELRIIAQNPDNDMNAVSYSRKRKVITAASFTSWKTQYVFLDPWSERLFGKIEAKLPGAEVRIVSATKDETKFIVRTFSDRSMGGFYLYDEPKDQLTELAQVGAHLPVEQMAEMKPIEYKSRDGLTIHGYLTLPKGAEAKKLPVVINPHGGPWARDNWRFNPEVQMLANRGFAVLQMNFRGSTGYGKNFWELSFKEWGRKMQDDVSDGVKWLIDQGIADKNRVCIYGGSYGGYATLAGMTFTPELYACGVDYVGVSNLFTFLNTIPPYWKPMLDQLYAMVGHPEKDKALLEGASPVFHVDKIKSPLLIVQGAKDPRVNKNEADQMVAALKKRGVEVPYLVKEDEGHGFHNEENRFEFYETMVAFLEKHLK